MARHLISTTMQPGRKVVVETGDFTDLDRQGVVVDHEEVNDETPLGEVVDDAEDEESKEVSEVQQNKAEVQNRVQNQSNSGASNSTPAGTGAAS